MKNLSFLLLLSCILWTQTNAQTHQILSVVASSQESQNPIENSVDNNLNTRWSGQGVGTTATLDLGSLKNFDQLRIVFYNSDQRWARFDLEVSEDGIVWSSIPGNTFESTSGTPITEFEDFNFTNQYARYLRYIGQGNQDNDWNSIWEIQVVNTSLDDDIGNSDSQAPSTPTLASTGQADIFVDLSWSGATDNVGVTGYRIYKDNVLETTLGNVSAYQVTSLTTSTTYTFKIRAFDAAGNESSDSNTISVTTNDSSTGGNPNNNYLWTGDSSEVSYSGNVAIGRSSVPTGYKMAVEGKIRTREVRVDQENWPDYVFGEDYNLPTLDEIQKHIDEKGHLPNMPSAKEVETNGMELGEMDRLLLQKIEELTLYILKQDHIIQRLQHELNAQKQ
ncbi:MAG: discoidin domain-containing protein [Bacteroidota bacterium]